MALNYADLEQARADAIDATLEQFESDQAKIAEADEWCRGEQSQEHYNALESAMVDLHEVAPADLIGSDVLIRLQALAAIHAAARAQRLRDMAEEAVEADYAERERNHVAYLADRRAAA